MRYCALGRVGVETAAGFVDITGEYRRLLFQILLVSEGRPVLHDVLIEELWGGKAPGNAENALQAHISRIRRHLATIEPGRGAGRVQGHPQGYRFDLDGIELDTAVFANGIDRAARLRFDDPDAALRQVRASLALWQGPLADSTGRDLLRAAGDRYEAYRLRGLATLFDIELERGRHAAVLADIQAVHSQYTLREDFCEHYMLALYRSGSQVEALDAFRSLRSRLADELGLDPSPRLCALEQAILDHAPALQWPRWSAPPLPQRSPGLPTGSGDDRRAGTSMPLRQDPCKARTAPRSQPPGTSRQ
ncbi:BTAD domain-containing putative transcriptional regulator [Kitasatospora sp. NPDC059577]|uniref:AfsR/SARP family transcriptional regulator n=1 Tax=Kitasatospora sp. NPDC059577 TaxID=3346873 RepID=UPI0036A17DEA